MERGREGRRGGVGGGSVSAPRRPRSIGFKDASVGEDGDDMMDDVPNPRLRERPKKDNSSFPSVHGLQSSGVGSAARSKRKRHGSQEVQDQARSSTVDDVDETTEDTEMGVSDEDDDPPPPPIPRRAVKFRPQGKLVEDGLNADLPAVPRKARTAILKRPQEATSPSVVDAFSHQVSTAILRTPAPSSAPSSSSFVSLKPGRQTKPVSAKSRASKVAKVSTHMTVSEQEVEVAEALFDLARLFTDQPILASQEASVNVMAESKPKMEPYADSGVNFEQKTLVDHTTVSSVSPQGSLPLLPASISVSCLVTASQTSPTPGSLTVCSSFATATAPPPAVATPAESAISVASPRPPLSPPSATVVPPAEAPKRKRPRFRTRSDEVGSVSQVPSHGSSALICNSPGLPSPLSRPQSQQIFTSISNGIDDSFVVGAEVGIRASAACVLVPNSVTFPLSISTARDPPVLVPRNIPFEEKSVSSVKNVAKVEVNTSFIPAEKNQKPIPDRAPILTSVSVGSPPAVSTLEMEPALRSTTGYPEYLTSGSDGGQAKKFVIDLMVDKESENETDREQEKKHEIQWDGECGNDLGREKERDTEKECVQEEWREQDKGDQIELSKERDREKELEGAQFSKQSPPIKSAKALRLESRGQRVDGAASVDTNSAPIFLTSALPGASTAVTSVSSTVAALPKSMGMAGWPLSLPSIGYFTSGAATAGNVGWPGGGSATARTSVDEHISSAVQLQQPYIIQARQPHPWKRCASHVYIAHFIDAQQQMNRHPFIHAAYQNSASLFGAKSYNLNTPLTPADALFAGCSGGLPLLSGASSASGISVVAGGGTRPVLASVPGSDRNLGAAAVFTSTQAKDRVYMDALSWKQVVQQLPQPPLLSPNFSVQANSGFGFPVTQANTAAAVAAAAVSGGPPVGDSGSGGGAALIGLSSSSATGSMSVATPGAGASNGAVVSHATAQAQYLQAVMQQGGFPFPFQAASHFGPGFSGTGHQQAAQYFSSPFYGTHLVHPPAHAQQQAQQSANVSAVPNHLQPPQQQGIHSFPVTTSQQQQQQQQSMPLSLSPSPAQQQHSALDSPSQQVQRTVERQGNNTTENINPSESKFSSLQRNVYCQGSSSMTVSTANPSSLVLEGVAGVHSLPPQDFSFVASLGGRPAKQQQQNQLASPQHHASTGPALQMGLKGIDQQSSHTFSGMSVAAMNRASAIGPGPLGLAPVAPVMAPQGHAMLQSMSDSSRGHAQQQQQQHHQSVVGQSQQHSAQSGQQQQRAVQMPRGATISGIEDSRTSVDGNSFPTRCGREAAEERKLPAKRGVGSTLNISRIDHDGTTAIQVSPPGGVLPASRMAGSVCPTLNLMTPTSAIIIPRSSGHHISSIPQQSGPLLPANMSSKQVMPRSKLLSGSVAANSVTSTPSQLSFPERLLPGPSSSNKLVGPSLSLPGQNLGEGCQVPRQSPVPQQHIQLKLSNRVSLGSLPTPSGTAPQAVLAAAIAKSQQVVQQQHSRPQVLVVTNTGPLPRLGSSNLGALSTSCSIPLPLSPASKSAPIAAKSTLCGKGSFPLIHKTSSSISSKRAIPPSGPNVNSILGPTLVQNPSTKASLQPNQCSSQHHTQSSQQLPPQPLQQPPSQPVALTHQQQQKYHHQQVQINPQQPHQVHNQPTLMQQQQSHHMQRQAFLQNPAFQQHQHAPGSQLGSHPQQQAGPHQQTQQQSLQQIHQQVSSPSSQPQLQQHPSSQLHHQQQSIQQQQQHNMHGATGSVSGTIANGNLSLGPPLLTLGTGSNGNNNSSAWGPCSDGGTASQCSGARPNPATNNKVTTGGSAMPSPSSQRSHCGAPTFLHSQFGSGIVSPQRSSSPRNSSGTQYLQPVANSGANGVSVEEKVVSGGVQRKAEMNSVPKL